LLRRIARGFRRRPNPFDLKRIIPDYMIPSVFHREQALPKIPTAKLIENI
jgi:hypothetical protein